MTNAPRSRRALSDAADSQTARPLSLVPDLESCDQGTRLVLNQSGTGSGPLHGGWWPRSRGAREQLPDLVAGLTERFGPVLRLDVDALGWDVVPHQIAVAGHVVRVGRYTDTNHVIIVTFGVREHVRLLVVPPPTAERAALAALKLSARPGDLAAPEILKRCGIETGPVSRWSARSIASSAA